VIRSRTYLAGIALLLLAAGFTALAGQEASAIRREQLPAQQTLAGALMLTDLALWSEARYTRHPSMTDLFSPFQDHPGAMEHFPAGALIAPVIARPQTTLEVRRRGEQF